MKENYNISGIYCIENLNTNKKYIGQSVNIGDRWAKHKSELNRNIHDNDYLQKAWNKYGESQFSFYVVEECPIEDLDAKEKYYIEYYDSINREKGYNLKTGGQDNGAIVCDEVKAKISNALKRAYSNDSNLVERRRQSALMQWSNPETKEKICGENNGMYGKTHTEEARKKIGERAKGRISANRNLTPIICLETNHIYDCVAEAAQTLHILSSDILRVCRGQRKTAGGYHWQFIQGNNI